MEKLSDIKNARGNPLYLNLNPLGKGFKSSVVSAERNPTFTLMGLGRRKGEVAIKVPLDNPEAQAELSHEAKIYKRLGQHRNILNLYDNKKDPSYLVMERAGRTALSAVEKIKNDKNMSNEQKNKIYCAFAKDMLTALLYSRSRKVLQNDAHTENYVLKDGILKIIDFGSSEMSTELYFPLQNPKRFEGRERNPQFDYHPIDAVIRILDEENSSADIQGVISILKTIGRDITKKDELIITEEDIINSSISTDDEKKQAHHDISRKMKEVILKLSKISASSCDIKRYFDYIAVQEKRQEQVKSYPIDFDK